MAWDKTDRSFKTLINKRTTSNVKAFYEEIGDNTLNINLGEVWTQNIPITPVDAVTQNVAELRTSFPMTEDVTVGSQQCYFAISGGRLKDWISDKYGSAYTIHLYQNSGAEIFPTDLSGWFFDYKTGILTFSGSTAGFAKPFKITGYRYIGSKGAVFSDATVIGQFVNGTMRYPLTDGSASQVLGTDGSGHLSWVDNGVISLAGREVYQIYDVTTAAPSTLPLAFVPANTYAVRMVPLGGVEMANTIDYTVSGNTVTYLGATPLGPGDSVLFTYLKS